MKKSAASGSARQASELITKRIAALEDTLDAAAFKALACEVAALNSAGKSKGQSAKKSRS